MFAANPDMPYPADRSGTRQALMDSVSSILPLVKQFSDSNETNRTLAPEVTQALRSTGLIKMKSPRAVGGAELHPVDQMDVIEALTMADPATAWAHFISSGITGRVLSMVSDTALREMLADGRFPMIAGSLKPSGTAKAVDGGYQISGRWAWGSGIHHADYISVPVFSSDRSRVLRAVLPRQEVTIEDNWFSLGMRGSGSSDYYAEEVFVPTHFVSDSATTLRGGAIFRMGYGYAVSEHGIFAFALGKFILQSVVNAAHKTQRGYGKASSVAHREVFQRAVAEGELRLRASRLLLADALERLYDAAHSAKTEAPAALQAEARAVSVLCTDEAIAVATNLFRYAGGAAVMSDSPLQRVLRDLLTIQSHLMVSDSAYEILGQLRLGLSDKAPLR